MISREGLRPQRSSKDTTEAASEGTVVLEAVTPDTVATLRNLFELYAHDFSEHVPLPVKPSGRFEVGPSDVWWTRDGHFAYLIKQRGELAGFALARAGSRLTDASDVMDVAEFFVLRGARARGIGQAAAYALFRTFPRAWEIRVRRSNVAAFEFWSRVAERWSGHAVASRPFAIDGLDWDLLRVDARSV